MPGQVGRASLQFCNANQGTWLKPCPHAGCQARKELRMKATQRNKPFAIPNLGCSLKKIRFIKLERPTSLDPKMGTAQREKGRREAHRGESGIGVSQELSSRTELSCVSQ
jgi:hypothetical protein